MENNADSVDIIFDVLQKEYEAEESRNKHLETKAQIMLALCGIIISANMFLLKVVIESHRLFILKITLLSIVLFLITYALYELLNTLKIKAFEKLPHNVLSDKSTLKYTSTEIKYKLIHDYNKCINASFNILDSKVKSIKSAANLIEVAVVLFCIVLLLVITTSYFERIDNMPKNNTTTTGNTTTIKIPQPPIKPTRSEPMTESSNNQKGEGFGTITVERGHQK